MNMAAGGLDRRIRVEQATLTQDAAGDELPASWGPPAGWPRDGRRWAAKRDHKPQEQGGDGATQVLLRQVDTIFTLRFDRFSSVIAPESFRVVYRDRPYQIVGLGETASREDGVQLLCSSRPDQRGSSAPEPDTGAT